MLGDILISLDPDKRYRVTVDVARKERSLAQNSYLWAVPYKLLSERTGYEPDEIHEYLLGRHFGWKDKRVPKTPRNPAGIESVPMRTTTTDENGRRGVLSKMEFAAYVDFIQRFAAQECGVLVPDPDPAYFEHRRAA